MRLGFIGTGTISEAIIEGLIRAGHPVSAFLVSARGQAVSARLAGRHAQVRVMADNQAIIDGAEAVILAIRPQGARAVLSGLRFAPGQPVISLIAGLPAARLQGWIGAEAAISRAIPLPSVAEGHGVTAIHPPTPLAEALFGALGTVAPADTAEAFDAYAVGSAMMGTCFGLWQGVADWMQGQGVGAEDARAYLAGVFAGLARTCAGSEADFTELRLAHSTPGGINAQLYEVFAAEGGLDALRRGLDSVRARVGTGLD